MRKGKRRTIPPNGITIAEAYTELTHPGFALWVRLMVEPERVLQGGVTKLGAKLGYKRRGFYHMLQELRNKGYIRVISHANPHEVSKVVIQRRAMLIGRDHFIKLS